jgi:hypothetical protein
MNKKSGARVLSGIIRGAEPFIEGFGAPIIGIYIVDIKPPVICVLCEDGYTYQFCPLLKKTVVSMISKKG